MNENITILYVDDEVNNLNSFSANFRKEYKILVASSGKEGLEILKTNKVNVIITDQQMSEMSGIDFLAQALITHNDPVRILSSANFSISTIINAVNEAHIDYYLKKPWDIAHVKKIISAANRLYLYNRKEKELIQELSESNEEIEKILQKNKKP